MPADARRIGLTLALGTLLVVIDTTVTVVAVPAMVTGLDTTLPAVGWVTTAYLLGIVAVIPLATWSANRFGARRVYLAALLVFVAGSILAGLATTVTALVACRAVQGLGGGLLNPVGSAIGLRAVAREHRGRLMSFLALPLVIGPVCGPPLAGWLIEVTSWRWIFLINVPLGLLALLVSARALPADPAPGAARERIDGVGLALLSGGAVLVVLGGTLLDGVRRAAGAGLLVAGLVLLAGFTRRALRGTGSRDRPPLVDLWLLGRPPFGAGAGVLVCFGAAYFGTMAVLPLYAQGVRGDSVAVVGALSLPQAVAVGVTAQVATRLVDRLPAHRIVLTGTVLGLAGVLGLFAATVADAGYPLVLAASVLVGAGSGATLMPAMTLVLRDLDQAETPRGTTLLNLLQRLSAALGVAAVAVVLNVLVGLRLPGGVAAMLVLDAPSRSAARADLAAAVGGSYLIAVALIAASVVIALRALPGTRARVPADRGHPRASPLRAGRSGRASGLPGPEGSLAGAAISDQRGSESGRS
ncbi:EmrB/QacA subfamily drug resistance transporter [Actinoplanes octamycinicus]|uniref:EmrB/QacA subfamily drug resistance transporter n=1 Tax=Actinoplanes octamycinicus TaxID=135948 RepID=A0A7W7GYL4_9ACTN|nr:DHA2 family efflux MFS transporter permease subunit [Actinoplanes octamycinicus]MBB4740750.1 EmrB/QacA subfamily drug resistance transporter [Actinoplanes octamycinicus]